MDESQKREEFTQRWLEAEPSMSAYVFASIAGFLDAEDVVQRIAQELARRFDEYDSGRSFAGWALLIAKSRVIDYYRAQGRSRVVFSDELLRQLADTIVCWSQPTTRRTRSLPGGAPTKVSPIARFAIGRRAIRCRDSAGSWIDQRLRASPAVASPNGACQLHRATSRDGEPMMLIDDDFIDRVLEGEVSDEEATAFLKWLKVPANLQHFTSRLKRRLLDHNENRNESSIVHAGGSKVFRFARRVAGHQHVDGCGCRPA